MLKSTKDIQAEYAAFLDSLGVPYINRQDFHVLLPLANAEHSFTQVCAMMHDGKILLTDYCGNCYTGIRAANRVAKAIRSKFPDVDTIVEHYGASFELDVYDEHKFTTIEDLHQRVLRIAEVVDYGAAIGKEMLGDDFER